MKFILRTFLILAFCSSSYYSNAQLSTSATVTNPSCNGANDATITISVSGGTGPYSYTIYPPGTNQSSNVFTGLGANTYLIVTIDSGASVQDTLFSVQVSNPSPFLFTGFSGLSNPSCYNSCNGTATANTAGGATGSKTYSWSTGGSSASLSNLCGGTYTVTVTDPNGCTTTGRLTQVRPPVLWADTDSTLDVTCFGGNDGAAYLHGHGDFATTSTSSIYTLDQTHGAFGPYGYDMSGSSNISNYQSFTLGDDQVSSAVNIGFTFSFSGSNQTQFVISSNGNIQFGSTGSNAYINQAIPSGAAPNNWVGIVDDLNPGAVTTETIETYLITNTNGKRARVVNFKNVPHYFAGNASGLFTFQIVLYETSNIIEIHSTNIPTVSAETYMGRTQGIENAAGSQGMVATGRNNTNWGATNDYIAFLPNQLFTYTWSSIGSSSQATNLTAGNYTVTVSNGSCSDIVNFTIDGPTDITVSSTPTNPTCNGDSNGVISASATGGNGGAYTYAWSTGASTASISNLPAGTYTVTVTDNAGCTKTGSITLTNPTPVSVSLTTTNVSCNGGTNGSVTASGSGGTGTFTYSWNTGASGSTVSGLATGTYTVTASDANGCTASATTTITQPTTAVSVTIGAVTNVTCFGGSNGQATATGSGGTGTITYAWSGGGTSATKTGMSAATYTVTATDANGCTSTATVAITQPASGVSVTIGSVTNVSCNGGTNGQATASGSGGSGSISYAWSGGGTSATKTGMSAGTYTVTATDGSGCTATAAVTITQPAAISIPTLTRTNTSCNGGNNGTLTANPSGGTSPYSYAWSNGGTGNPITGLTAGTYTVTVTDNNGCTNTASRVITQPTAISITTTITNVTCAGGSNGAITASASGGTGGKTYSWSTGATGATVSGLTAGTYTVTATDANSCTASATATITEPASSVTISSFSSISDPTCDNDCDGAATVNVSGGAGTISYLWSNGDTTNSPSNLCGTSNYVTVTDANSCQDSAMIVLVETPQIWAELDSSFDILCNGDTNGAAYISAHGAFAASTSTSAYIVDQTHGSFEPYGYGQPANAVSYQQVTLADDATSAAINIFEGTTNFNFFGNNFTQFVICSQGFITFNTALANQNSGGLYSNSPTMPNGAQPNNFIAGFWEDLDPSVGNCTIETYLVGNSPNRIRVVNYINIDHYFNGSSGSGDISTFQIVLYESSNIIQIHSEVLDPDLSNGGLHVQGIENSAGTAYYAVTGRNNTNFSATNDYVAFIPQSQNINYTWSSIGSGSSSNALSQGNYTVTVSDGTCEDTVQFSIDEPSPLAASFSNIQSSACSSCTGQATASISGGTSAYSLLWPNSQTAASATLLCAGMNQLFVTDNNGCVDSFSILIPSDSADTVYASGTNPSCNGGCDGSVTATTSSSGSSFQWIDLSNSTSIGTSQTVSGLCSGTYAVVMTNASGCVSTDTVTITDPLALSTSITSSTNVTCFGGNNGAASASASGGTSPYTFTWPGSFTGSNVSGLTAGTYTVTATDNNGCTETASVVITQPATGLSVNASVITNVSCFGNANGSATASASGANGTVIYVWNGSLNGATINGLTAGTYTVVVTDTGSCTATDSVTITEPALLSITVASSSNPLCPGDSNGSITVSVSGGTTPYSYQWSSGGTAAIESNLSDGTYTLTVTDNNGCTDTEVVTLSDPTGMSNSFTGVGNSGCSICDGTATANVSGGTSPYTYNWSNGQNTASNDSLCSGFNAVTVTDNSGCIDSFTVAISANGADTVSASGVSANCSACDGSAFATYNCSNGPCTVQWTIYGSSFTIGNTDTITNLCEETYAVQLTNNAGCISIDTVTIGSTPPISPNAAVTDASCNGSNDGSIVLSPSGGSGTFSYNWSNGAGNSPSNLGITAGTYTVTISDAGGCDTIASFIVSDPSGIQIFATITNTTCYGVCDGSAMINPSGGAGSYTYNWSPIPGNGQGVQLAQSLCSGTYFLTVSDVNGCSNQDTILITEPNQIIEDSVNLSDAQCGQCDGSIEAYISGGTGSLVYSWNSGQSTNIIDSLCFGGYSLDVTDASGCTAQFNYPVSETNAPTITISVINVSQSGLCDGSATATVVTSQGTVTFQWSNGDVGPTADSLCSGVYFITATDSNGCHVVDTLIITEPGPLQVALSSINPTCIGGGCNGSVLASATGGASPYSYLWSTGANTASDTALCSGTYTVTVVDNSGTTVTASLTLNSPTSLTINNILNNETCSQSCNGSIELIIGGPVASILWSNGDTNSITNDLCAGIYYAIVTDTSGCSDSVSYTITGPPPITAGVQTMIHPTCQGNDGVIEILASGGNGGPFNYLWLDVNQDTLLPLQMTDSAVNLFAGIYSVAITDNSGCVDTLSYILNNNNAPVITVDSILNVSCNGACDGAIYTTISGGTPPYSVFWTSGWFSEDISNLCAGFDTIVVADTLMCLSFDYIEITEPDAIIADDFKITATSCGGSCDGQINVSIIGGTAPYDYNWSNGGNDSTISDLCAGIYDLTVTDANGCQLVTGAVVPGAASMTVVVDSANDATCTYTGNGNVWITVSGGSPGYSYLWSNGQSTLSGQDLNNVTAGTYHLTVTDTSGCTYKDTFTINTKYFVDVAAMEDFEVCPLTLGLPITSSMSGSGTRRWLSDSGVVIGLSGNIKVDILKDSNYFIIEAINGVCVARDTLLITTYEGPGIDAGLDRVIEPGAATTIGGEPTAVGGVDVVWTPDNDISSTIEYNPQVYPLQTTVYYVSGYSDNGCYGIDSVTVVVEKVVNPVGGFSPNGDGVNDYFYIGKIERYPSAVVTILNRWGNQIFQSEPGYSVPWNGRFRGNELPVGTYYYIIDLNDANVNKPISGSVVILK